MLIEKQEKERLEDRIAEIIDPESFSGDWDRERQYVAIKRAEEILELVQEELPFYVKNTVIRELEENDDIKVISVEDLDDLENVEDIEPDGQKAIEDVDVENLQSVAEYVRAYDFEDIP